jgi:hypothetical protein
MKIFSTGLLMGLLAVSLSAETHYVNWGSTNPVAPFLSWDTAAAQIQQAVDVATSGSTVVVTNGIYNTGGFGANRVSIVKEISVESVNGPDVTIIDGTGSLRGVFLNNNGSLSGFTVTNGYTSETGGGIWLNDGCTVFNCIVTGNRAGESGGGVYLSYGGVVNNSVLSGNNAESVGGGAYLSFYGGELNNCLLIGNSAFYYGGGAYLNIATMNNCTVTENSSGGGGDGVSFGEFGDLYNCIVWGNEDDDIEIRDAGHILNTCARDDVIHGVGGNITNKPLFADALHVNYQLQAGSPCINAGDNTYAPAGVDLLGNPRTTGATVDMGAYEYNALPMYKITTLSGTNGAILPENPFIVQGQDVVLSIQPDVGYHIGSLTVDSVPQAVASSHTFTNVQSAHTIEAAYALTAEAYYVDASRPDDSGAGTNWATAKRTIQAAVDIAGAGTTVWVTNGVYDEGEGWLPGYPQTARVAVVRSVALRSVNESAQTIIDGKNSIRGVLLFNGASLIGFTITGGRDNSSSGGVYMRFDSTASSCILTGNFSGWAGGGAIVSDSSTMNHCLLAGNTARKRGAGASVGAFSTLNNSILVGNSANGAADSSGGGALLSYGGTLNNCTVTENSAIIGGGVVMAGETVNNSIVWNNTASSSPNLSVDGGSITRFTCAPDGLAHGVDGCITNTPFFIDSTNGNFRLQTGSPCINAGNNSYVVTTNDLDSLSRIVGGVVDMGAYERQDTGTDVDSDELPDYWEMTHFNGRHFAEPSTISANGVDTLLEAYIAGFDPNDPGAAFLISILPYRILEWNARPERAYTIYWSSNLVSGFQALETNYTSGVFTDTLHSAEPKGFYRVDVQIQE